MPEIHVVALIPAKPEAVDELRAGLLTLADETRKEEGCLRYDVFTSAADPATFVTVELWRSQEDIDAHFTTPHIAAAMAATEGRLAGALAIHPLVPVT
jgi:quinol monooxygenase YgiN